MCFNCYLRPAPGLTTLFDAHENLDLEPHSVALRLAVEKIVDFIDDATPLIIESVLPPNRLSHELESVGRSFQNAMSTIGIPD